MHKIENSDLWANIRGLGATGDALTAASKKYRSVDLEVGDDGQIYAL